MGKQIKVSIVVPTYNQEKYIRQALDSFVMQKTDFAFEIIAADDCSTDKTPDIIKEYATKYPDMFKPILRKKNVGVLQNYLGAMRAAQGVYITLCEGDDYWTDPEKLQLQADFLDKNRDYALCFHPVTVFFENSEEADYIYPNPEDKAVFTTKELLKHNFIQTNSVMYRKQKYDNMPADIMPVDLYLHLFHSQFGKIGFINRNMAAYRRHPGGVWWDSYGNQDKIWEKYALPHLGLFVALRELYVDQPDYMSIIDDAIDNMFSKIIDLDKKLKTKQLSQVVKNNPEVVVELIIRHHNTKQENIQLQQETSGLRQLVSDQEHQIKLKDQKIALIQGSRVWKTRNQLAKKLGREELWPLNEKFISCFPRAPSDIKRP